MSDVILFSCREAWQCFELCRRLQDFRISFTLVYDDSVVGTDVNGGNPLTVRVAEEVAYKASYISAYLLELPFHVMEAEARDDQASGPSA